jgi:putative DNA methylase
MITTPPKPAFRKKLIEVSIPLEVINRESAREKSIRHGHPSTLHLWWARRPLAACRAVLFAQLVDDPSSCPEEFPTKALQDAERDRLHKIIEAIVPWEATQKEYLLNEARYEIARSFARGKGEKLLPLAQIKPQAIIDYLQTNAPPVYDPFSGGGSIPLEAQRLGLRAMGSDLNPVAVLIGKALIEFPPKFAGRKPVNPEVNELHQWKGAQGLADDVRYYGRWMRAEAEKKIGHLYPKVTLADGTTEATVIAWLWARTVPSPDPRAKGAQVPLVSSFVLSAKPGREVIVSPVVDRKALTWAFAINDKPSADELKLAKTGTKSARATFSCILTGAPIPGAYIDAEAAASRMSERLMAVVAEGKRQRIYVAPAQIQVTAAGTAATIIAEQGHAMGLPTQECRGTFASNALGRRYKFKTFADYFTPRQLVALTTFSDLVMVAREKILVDATAHWSGATAEDSRSLADGGFGPVAYADAVATYLGLLISRQANYSSTNCIWSSHPKDEIAKQVFLRQGIVMTWDFAEVNLFGDSGGTFSTQFDWLAHALQRLPATSAGEIRLQDAATTDPREPTIISTDPPYYDNIGYADLSDFFYVWQRRALSKLTPELFRRLLTPKAEELIANPYRHGGDIAADEFFLTGMKKALTRIAEASNDGPTTIYYAFKQSETDEDGVTSAGWASFLQAIMDSGLAVDGTWPVRTELAGNLKKTVNALASSIVLVCRRREAAAPTITRADFLRALRREMPDALAEIRRAGVAPTDIQQAAIGPGIGVFTRHAQVLNTDGTPLMVKDALKLINQVREEIASAGDAAYDNETSFALDWFSVHGFDKGKSSDAIIMTQATNVSLDGVKKAGFFYAKGSVARLLKRDELADDYDPAKAKTPTVWEACQHLIKRLTAEDGGIDAAAALYGQLGALAEPAHALARRLYDICEQKQWAAEGRVYNQLHQEWDAIEKRATALAEAGGRRDLFSR